MINILIKSCFAFSGVIHGIQKTSCKIADYTSIWNALAHSVHCQLKNIA